MSDPQWRLYCNLDAGAFVHTAHGRLELEPLQLYVLPAWLRWHGSTVENNFVDLPFSLQAEVAFQCYEKIFQKVGVYPTLYIYSMIV